MREPCESEYRPQDGMRAGAEPSPTRERLVRGRQLMRTPDQGRNQNARKHTNRDKTPLPAHTQMQIQLQLKSEARKLDHRKGGKKQKAASGT